MKAIFEDLTSKSSIYLKNGDASCASAKVAVSYNGKNRQKQVRTNVKSSGEKTKDLMTQFIYDNLTLILECQVKI